MADETLVDRRVAQAHADTVAASSGGTAVDPSVGGFEAGTRYEERRVIGAGGMGEVRLCADRWIGRDVAMKVVRAGTGSASETRGRFLREARVQGQLEHPSIVPVYDIGRTPEGEAFFTMKRIGGATLERIVAGLHDAEPAIVAGYSRRKLLSAMSQVCLTVAYAHSRGVVHRDLKPANVMLGDFGEVYVLDWGVAKIAGAADLSQDAISGEGEIARTQQGSLVGTPGHMAPEQARGEVDRIGPASDVYALGAMLFEVLVLEPLHRGTTLAQLVASAQRPCDVPSARAPDARIPPELDAICARATALEPEERFSSARAMHEAIERYLDGERDAERRKELAHERVQRALGVLARANAGGADAEGLRAEGVRTLGQAIALDPTNDGALRALGDALVAPAALPPEGVLELKQTELRDRADASRRAARTYAMWLAIAPLCLLLGVRSWVTVAVIGGLASVTSLYARFTSTPERAAPRYMRVQIVLNFLLIAAASAMAGPFILVPTLAVTSAAALVIGLRANQQTRRMIYLLAFLSVFAPATLQAFGILPSTYRFANGVLEVHPWMVDFPPSITPLVVWTFHALLIVVPAVLIGRSAQSLVQAEVANFAQAWRLRQLLPAKKP